MDFISKLFIIPVLLLVLSVTYIVAPLIGIKRPKHQNSPIDGFRGGLAMFVFLHHSAIWWYFSHIHEWSHVPSDLYNHFGTTSVSFFFMITAFLFFSKLINSFSTDFDWIKLYTSRIMRIMPLYFFAIIILVLIICFISRFEVRESLFNLSLHVMQWSIFMEPNINKIQGTRFINSGVQWSLAYEWVFYCSLPIIGWLFFRIRTSIRVIILTAFSLAAFLLIIHEFYPVREWKTMSAFLPGVIAAFLARNERIKIFCSNQLHTLILIVLPLIVLFNYSNVLEPIPYLCATLIFIAIACGNTFFGILTSKPFLLLGQISYSIYLLHGFILFITFYFLISPEKAEKLPIITYWEIVCICAVAVVLLSFFTYYFIEKPCIDHSMKIAIRIKLFFIKEKPDKKRLSPRAS